MHLCKHCKKNFGSRREYEAHLMATTYHGVEHVACPELVAKFARGEPSVQRPAYTQPTNEGEQV